MSTDGSAAKADIVIYDVVGPEWAGMVSAKYVSDALAAYAPSDEVHVRISSPGGDIIEGLAIYNRLANWEGPVTIDIDGGAISIASVIAMAGDKIRMARNASFMIHDPWGYSMGDAAEMRKTAEILDQMKNQIVGIYKARTGMKPKQLADMMTAETWLTADDAKAKGFVTEITENKSMKNMIAPGQFKNMPQWVKGIELKDEAENPWRRNLAKRRLEQLRCSA